MKRDMKLIKLILKHAEKSEPDRRGWIDEPEIPGYEDTQIGYHLTLCVEAGYIRVNSTGQILALTWAGHSALDDLRARGQRNCDSP